MSSPSSPSLWMFSVRCVHGYTSMEDEKTRFTMAAIMAVDPRRHGRRNCTLSTLAVTTGPRATVFAAKPAAISIQLKTCPQNPEASSNPHPNRLAAIVNPAQNLYLRPRSQILIQILSPQY